MVWVVEFAKGNGVINVQFLLEYLFGFEVGLNKLRTTDRFYYRLLLLIKLFRFSTGSPRRK